MNTKKERRKQQAHTFLKEHYWIIIFTLLFIGLAIPFLQSDANHWDMVGHKFSAEMQKEMFPNTYFFNPYFFTGVDEFTSYPPLFSWLVMLISFITGIEFAFKAIIFLSWITIPFAFAYYAKSIQNKKQATLSLAIFSIYLITTIQHIGVTYLSTFLVGNVANALAMPFFLITIGALLRKNYKLAIFTAIPVFLSHYIATIVLSVFLLINFFFDKETLKMGFSYGIAAIWLLPAILTIKANIKTHDDYLLGFIELGFFLLFFIAYYIFTLLKKENKYLNIFFFIFTIFSFEYITLNYFPILWQSIPMHYHRLKIYAISIGLPLFILVLNNIWEELKKELKKTRLHKITTIENWNKTKKTIYSISIIAIILYLAFFGYSSADLINDKFVPQNITITGARIMTVDSFENPVYFNHNQRYALAEKNNMILKGLFVEASPDSPMIFALEQKLKTNGTIYRWGVNAPLLAVINNETMNQPSEFYLDLFGAQYIISKEEVNLKNDYSQTQFGNYTVTKLPTTNLVEVPKYNISFINTQNEYEWNDYLNEWYKSSNKIVVELKSKIQSNISQDYKEKGYAELINQEDNYNELKIKVESKDNSILPVYIKFLYSKNWEARTQDGQVLPIYRATPNNMMIFTNQDFTLKYNGFNTKALAGLIITIISILIYIFYFDDITRLIRKSNF